MTKIEFINSLKKELKCLKKEERNKFLEFYSEMINDKIDSGMSEYEAVNSLENPKIIAAKILCDKDEAEFIKPNRSTTSLVLVIIGSPVWFSLLVAVFAVIFAIFCAAWAVLIGFFAAGIGISVSSLASFIAFFVFLFKNPASAFGILGIGFVLLAITIVLVKVLKKAIIFFAKYSFKFLKNTCIFVYNKAKEILFGSAKKDNSKVLEETTENACQEDFDDNEKSHKFIYILSLISLVCGVIIFTISFASINFNIQRFSTVGPPVLVQKVEELSLVNVDSEEIFVSEINLDLSYADVKIEKTDEQKISIDYYENENLAYTYKNENGIISLTQAPYYFNIFELININFYANSEKVFIKIPNSYTDKIIIHTASGNIEVVGEATYSKVDISTSTGKIILKKLNADEFKISTNTGGIDASEIKANGAINLSATTGDVIAFDIIADSVNILTKTGDIESKNVSSNQFKAEANTGRVHIDNVNSTEKLIMTANTGELIISKITSKEIVLSTSTGSIFGSILGKMSNYKIVSNTKTGSNNLTNSLSGENILTVTTSTGSIKIVFALD